jgi:hypothetical protein
MYRYAKNDLGGLAWLFGVIAIAYNPLLPVYLTRGIWMPVDLIKRVCLSCQSFMTVDEQLDGSVHAAAVFGKLALSVQPASTKVATASRCASIAMSRPRQGWVGSSAFAPVLPTTKSPVARSMRRATP